MDLGILGGLKDALTEQESDGNGMLCDHFEVSTYVIFRTVKKITRKRSAHEKKAHAAYNGNKKVEARL